MPVASWPLGLRTSALLHRFGGEVIARGDCDVVRTPDQPSYYWGNFLVLPGALHDGELAHWLQRFEEEVAHGRPAVRHVAFAVLGGCPQMHALPSWRAAGFELMEVTTLVLARGALRERPGAWSEALPGGAGEAASSGRDAPLSLRMLDFSDAAQCDAHIALQASDPQGHEPEGYRRFRAQQMARFAELSHAGVGQWFGLWSGTTLVADCGLLTDGTLGRFQNVLTHPDWRRRGLCSALVAAVCRRAFDGFGLERLVMCADPLDVAIGIYESLGFERVGNEWGVQRVPAEDEGARRTVRLASVGEAARGAG